MTEKTPRAPSFKPFALNNPGTPRQKAFDLSSPTSMKSMVTLDPYQWNALALKSQAIPIGATLHSFQVQIANLVLMRHADAVVISSTGSGKSLTWTLPLLARKEGISLVITPFTSLGLDGELLNNCDGISSLFIYHEQNTQKDFELAAQGDMLLYRDSLIIYAGLKPDYTLVNLGNFKPELSTMILPMKHSVESFLDITFILPLGSSAFNLVRTIIYCDDLELLTKMFWWAFQRVSSMDLPTDVIDIIHSGLSARHQELCLEDFRTGKTSILFGSSKISAGMNFSGVRRVIQYKCRDLTIPDVDQRRGPGARGKDETAVFMIFVEPSMLENTSGQDPGMIELVQSDECAEAIIQKHLENPRHIRHDSYPCCNRCDPSLNPGREYQWIEVDPSPSTQTKQTKTTEELILVMEKYNISEDYGTVVVAASSLDDVIDSPT
ncbi:hypothetical protein B0H14DRAFT_2592415 [Mycena olivaceomarginata]|nr:hypothetical protein B0H14DRAFT_2592415 [Mycena olivaceomarginata]